MKKFHAFYWTRTFIAVFKRVCHLQISSARSIKSTLPNQCRLVKIYCNITFPSTPRSFKPSHPFRFPFQNPVRISLIKHTCHIPRPPYSPWFDHPNNTECVKNTWRFSKFEKQRASYVPFPYWPSSCTMMFGVQLIWSTGQCKALRHRNCLSKQSMLQLHSVVSDSGLKGEVLLAAILLLWVPK